MSSGAAGMDVQHMQSVVHPQEGQRAELLGTCAKIAANSIFRIWVEVQKDVTSDEYRGPFFATFWDQGRLQLHISFG
jgi:hypothetical protein